MSSLSADFCWCAYAVAEIAHTDVSIRRTMRSVVIMGKLFDKWESTFEAKSIDESFFVVCHFVVPCDAFDFCLSWFVSDPDVCVVS